MGRGSRYPRDNVRKRGGTFLGTVARTVFWLWTEDLRPTCHVNCDAVPRQNLLDYRGCPARRDGHPDVRGVHAGLGDSGRDHLSGCGLLILAGVSLLFRGGPPTCGSNARQHAAVGDGRASVRQREGPPQQTGWVSLDTHLGLSNTACEDVVSARAGQLVLLGHARRTIIRA